MFAGPPGIALLISRRADGPVVPMPMLPLGATINFDAPPCMRRAEDDGVAAAVVEGDLLGFLEEGRAALFIGVDRQRDGFEGAGRLAVRGPVDTGDRDQARDGLILCRLGECDHRGSKEETQKQAEHEEVTHRANSLENGTKERTQPEAECYT